MSLTRLVSDRGYVKGCLTRMETFCTSEDIEKASYEALMSKRQRLVDSFREYETLNKEILFLSASDQEDYEEYERKYSNCLTLLDCAMGKRKKEQNSPPPDSSKNGFKRLPPIEIKPFDGTNIEDFIPFINIFKAVFHSDANISPCQKLYYLRTYLQSEALDIIKNLSLTDDNYLSALELLEKRYNNVPMIVNHHINGLLDLPSFTKCTAQNLRSLVSKVNQHTAALKNLDLPVGQWDAILVNILSRKVDAYTNRGFHLERNEKELPGLSEFLDFIDKRAVAMENTASEKLPPAPPTTVKPVKPGKASLVSAMKQLSCKYCNQSHKLYECAQFRLLMVQDRCDFVSGKKLCVLCLNQHQGKCMLRLKCNICHKGHNTLVHSDAESNSDANVSNAATASSTGASPDSAVVMTNTSQEQDVLLPTVVVRLIDKNGKFIYARALLDSGSQVSFVTHKLAEKINCKISKANKIITGIIDGTNSVTQKTDLEVYSAVNNFNLNVTCFVTKNITCNLPQQSFDVRKLSIPSYVKLADKTFHQTGEISMLLGCEIFFQVLQRETLPLTPTGPYLVNTKFGYVVAGNLPVSAGRVSTSNLCITVRGNPLHNKNNTHIREEICNYLQQDKSSIDTQDQSSPFLDKQSELSLQEKINHTISQLWECEKVPNVYKEGTTEHQLAEESFINSVKLENKKFSVALPLKLQLDDVGLGDSFGRVLQRFYNLEKRFSKDNKLYESYKDFMHDYVSQGHAKIYDISNYDLKAGNVYFIPHHPILNPNSKTTPVRAVFDASMKTSNNLCLNDIMLNGPTVQNDLFDILTLFRTFRYVLLCDVKAMYRGILVDSDYRCLQNILWRDSPTQPVQCLQLQTVSYGLKSSAFLATRCLIELADRYKDEYPLAAFVLKNTSYVDDIQCGSNNLVELAETKRQLIELMDKASFSLHKWCSNCSELLSDIPESIHQLSTKHFDKVNNTYIKTLGLSYDVHTDTLNMKCPVTEKQKGFTKREMLSFISKFFDPLGLVGPVLVQAKYLMQQVWFENLKWDDVLPEHLNSKMVDFTNNLIDMSYISVPRNINVKSPVKMELVGYADASNIAHGCCLYLRVVSPDKHVKVNLLCSKSRINPKDKRLTTPRVELNSALLLAMLARKVYNTLSLKYDNINTFLYSDSKIVLSWLNIEPVKLTVYIANRVEKIRRLCDIFQWNYVNTIENPADCLSRGVEPQELKENSLWFHGPQYLQNINYVHCPLESTKPRDVELPELKRLSPASYVCSTINNHFKDFIEKYSDVEKMTRILSYVKRFLFNCKKQNVNKKKGTLCPDELTAALNELIKLEQRKHFEKEFKFGEFKMNEKSNLSSLNPFVDGFGLLRVGGRLQNATLTFDQKHPIILPKGSALTKLLIIHEHIRLKHAGQKMTLSSLHERYWLINANREVKSVLHKCVLCFRLKAKNARQLMGSLPLDRVNMARPFQIVGTDYAGAFNIKQTRIRKPVITKAYVVMFICFLTKAIHIELASDMTTNTFLGCLKRFISRRNKPTKIYCDNASYYRGANNVLKELYESLNSTEHQNKIIDFSNSERISFHFIPSYSPVFGGLWEAGIKSIKYHMKRVIGNLVLTYEEMYTVLVQIESILNSRPLTPLSRDSDDMAYLTPGHFLTGAPLTSYPELNLTDINIGKLSFWKQCTKLQQTFWAQWHKQYLTMLQSRPKWQSSQPNLQEGAMVLIKSDNVTPLQWPVGRIVKVIPGNDNLVRALDVKTPKGFVIRTSIMKVCPLPIDYN